MIVDPGPFPSYFCDGDAVATGARRRRGQGNVVNSIYYKLN